MVTATICTIGDEILIGQIVDTNSSKISTALNSIGVKVISMVSTSDTEEDIINTVETALRQSNVVVITGGLGPTKDDITKKTLGKLTGATADVENQEQLEIITRILSARGMVPLSALNRAQASVPNSCRVIPNEFGTAPCMEFEIPEDAVYLATAEDLLALAENCISDAWSRDQVFVLKNDIDLTGVPFTSIPTFGGTFLGQGFTISGLTLPSILSGRMVGLPQ